MQEERGPTSEKRPALRWEGAVVGGGSPPRSYFVALYGDGTGRCSCPDFYFRGVLRDARSYACKHIRRALADHPVSAS